MNHRGLLENVVIVDDKRLTLWQIMKLAHNPEEIQLNSMEKLSATFMILLITLFIIDKDDFRILALVSILEILSHRVLITMNNRSDSSVYLWISKATILLYPLYAIYTFGELGYGYTFENQGSFTYGSCLTLVVWLVADKPLVHWLSYESKMPRPL